MLEIFDEHQDTDVGAPVRRAALFIRSIRTKLLHFTAYSNI